MQLNRIFIVFRLLIGCWDVTCDLSHDVLTCRTLRQPSRHWWRQADRHLLPWRPAVHHVRDQVQSRPRRNGGQGSKINIYSLSKTPPDCYWLAAVSLIWLQVFHSHLLNAGQVFIFFAKVSILADFFGFYCSFLYLRSHKNVKMTLIDFSMCKCAHLQMFFQWILMFLLC